MVGLAKMEVFEHGCEEFLQVFGAPALQFTSTATSPEWSGEINSHPCGCSWRDLRDEERVASRL